jgi:hypothetical protein
MPMMQAETLGLRRFGSIGGLLGLAGSAGVAIGPALVGRIADAHSYTGGFELLRDEFCGSRSCKLPVRRAAPGASPGNRGCARAGHTLKAAATQREGMEGCLWLLLGTRHPRGPARGRTLFLVTRLKVVLDSGS